MAKHYITTIRVQEVSAAEKGVKDQYNRVLKPAKDREIVDIVTLVVRTNNVVDAKKAVLDHVAILNDSEDE